MFKYLTSSKSLEKKCDLLIYAAEEGFFRKRSHIKSLPNERWDLLRTWLADPSPGKKGVTFSAYTGATHPVQLHAVVLPDTVSRHNSPSHREQLFQALSAIKIGNAKNVALVVGMGDARYHLAIYGAAARLASYYNRKISAASQKVQLHLMLADIQGNPIAPDAKYLQVAEDVTTAFEIVNAPPNIMGPDIYARKIIKLFTGLKNTTVKEIKGAALVKEGLCGIHSVGKAAVEPPRMIVIDYKPSKPKAVIALIGKGLAYDSGGLSLKISGSLVGMKNDLAGSAAVVAATHALIKSHPDKRIIAIAGIAENAIGPTSYKVDDVITMHSGKTVEINNTDAEGRLVLADCLSYACKHFKPDVIVDVATLTGAQMVATGRNHAGFFSNNDDVEKRFLKAARDTGELLTSLPFAPEYFEDELLSEIADMHNSVKDRMNAPASGAAQFLFSHIEEADVPWAHIDMAGQACCTKGVATGYGVTLLYNFVMEFAANRTS